MLHHHLSTAAQNGQTKQLRPRGLFTLFSTHLGFPICLEGAGEGRGIQLVLNLQPHH